MLKTVNSCADSTLKNRKIPKLIFRDFQNLEIIDYLLSNNGIYSFHSYHIINDSFSAHLFLKIISELTELLLKYSLLLSSIMSDHFQ